MIWSFLRQPQLQRARLATRSNLSIRMLLKQIDAMYLMVLLVSMTAKSTVLHSMEMIVVMRAAAMLATHMMTLTLSRRFRK